MGGLKILIVIVLSLLSFISKCQVINGVFDASLLKNNEIEVLQGRWEFYPQKFLTYEDFKNYPSRFPKIIEVPGTWNSQGLPGKNFGTYKIRLRNLPVGMLLAISVPNVYSSYRLFLDDELISFNGVAGASKDETEPQWLLKTVAFIPHKDEADLIIHVSNFHHSRGGIHKNIYLGPYEDLQAFRENELMSQMMIFAGLGVLGFFFTVLYLIRQNKKYLYVLFFGLLCLAWAGRIFFAHIYLRSFFYPEMDWLLSLKLEYILLYLSLILGNLFLNYLFNLDRNLLFRSILIINVLFILVTMALPSEIFTALLTGFLGIALLNIGYFLYAIGTAIYKGMGSAWFAAFGIIFGMLLFTFEILAYQMEWPLNHFLLQLAYLFAFMAISFVLANEFALQEKKIQEIEDKQVNLFRSRF